MIPYAKQAISEQDIEAVVKVLRSDFITQGPIVPEFENQLAQYCGAKHAVAVNSGTSALHLACLALDVGPGDYVWTSPNTFVASANCARYCGANVDFVDIDPETYNISIEALEFKLITARKKDCLPKVLIPVHFAGQSCEMAAIKALSEQYGFAIIEDAAHALGGSYQDKKIGCCHYSDITIFSLHPAKMITTGEGGVLLSNDIELANKIELLRSHGITRNTDIMTEASHGDWYYQQLHLGFNYRITDIQAALGLSQLQRLDRFIDKRCQLVQRYNDKLKNLPVITPLQHPDTQSCWHVYVLRLPLKQLDIDRKTVFDQLRNAGIGVHVHYIPVHTQPYYQQLGFKPGDFLESEAYYQEAITLPLFVDLSNEEMDYIVHKLTQVLLPE